MFVFWTANVIGFTFVDPFRSLKNGWIASWVCFAFTLFHLTTVSSVVRDQLFQAESKVRNFTDQMAYVTGAIVMSLVELIAAAFICDAGCNGSDPEIPAYAVSVGVVGIILPSLLLIDQIPTVGKLLISLGNLIWWAVALLILTFVEDEFLASSTANGYIATWGATIFALLIAFPYMSAIGCGPNSAPQSGQNQARGGGYPQTQSSPPAYQDGGQGQPYRGTGGNQVA